MKKKIKVTDALTQVYTALCMLTVQGPDNARILATVCHDLKEIILAIENDGGEKQNDTSKDSSGDMRDNDRSTGDNSKTTDIHG